MELIDKHILNRTSTAIKCLALNCKFYKDVQLCGLSAEKVFKQKEKYLTKHFIRFSNVNNIEAAFRWLITIGVLRREVDGQGLTSKVRLTPLGRQLLQSDPELPNKNASFKERLKNWFIRKIVL